MKAFSMPMDGLSICRAYECEEAILFNREPALANLMIVLLDRRPGNAEGDFLQARVAAVLGAGAVESRPENILRMRRQVAPHGRRQILTARVRHDRELTRYTRFRFLAGQASVLRLTAWMTSAGSHPIFLGNVARMAV